MKTAFEKISYFNELIGNAKAMSSSEQIMAQIDMIKEEFDELLTAVKEFAEVDFACELDASPENYDRREKSSRQVRDGIADVLVTTYGLAHRMGIDADADLEMVYESNMSKFIQGDVDQAVKSALEVEHRLGIFTYVNQTDPGIWAITSAKDQTGSDGKSYPKGKLLKPTSFKEPAFR